MNARREPTSILIAALGGQGGGVLTGWIGDAARASGLVVQATSTPGVSQRTGATTYYVEMVEAPQPGQAPPVLGLAPAPGRVDVLVCAELLEAARTIERGLCTPGRTVVIASSHRVYTTREKMSGDDGRFDSARIVEALRSLARRIVVFDMDAVRARHRAAISAVIFGALAGSGAVPLSREACEAAIRDAGIGVAESLAAFAEAFACASEGAAPSNAPSAHTPEAAIPDRLARRLESMPRLVADIARSAVEQLVAYQDERYALWFVERTERVVKAAAGRGAGSGDVVRETVRRLALWMAYDDLIRVASLKSSASRFARIRSEVQARDGEIVRVRDFLRPGMSEIAAILPKRAGVWLERRILARAGSKPAGVSLTLHTSSVAGLLAMRALAAMRPLRPHSLRFAREQAAIEDWLALVERALAAHEDAFAEAALELSKLPRLLRGYGETHATGRAAFAERIDAYRNAGGAASASAVRALRQSTAAPSDCAPRRTANAHAAKAVRTQPVVWLDRR